MIRGYPSVKGAKSGGLLLRVFHPRQRLLLVIGFIQRDTDPENDHNRTENHVIDRKPRLFNGQGYGSVDPG